MVKLDVSLMRFLEEEDYRILTSLELCMRNHKVAPSLLIERVAQLKTSCRKRLLYLSKHRLVSYNNTGNSNTGHDGYSLNYNSYDLLALRTFLKRNVITGVGARIGCGKESDIFLAENLNQNSNAHIMRNNFNNFGEELSVENSSFTNNIDHKNEDAKGINDDCIVEEERLSNLYVLKLERLGRCSFRSVAKNRDYKGGVRALNRGNDDTDDENEVEEESNGHCSDIEKNDNHTKKSIKFSDDKLACEPNEFGLVLPSVAESAARARRGGVNTKPRRGESWFYLSRLAATKEFLFMQLLYNEGFPVPKPIDHNRHAIVMEYISDGVLLNNIEKFEPYMKRVRKDGQGKKKKRSTSKTSTTKMSGSIVEEEASIGAKQLVSREVREQEHIFQGKVDYDYEEEEDVILRKRDSHFEVTMCNKGAKNCEQVETKTYSQNNNDCDYKYVEINTAQLVYDRCVKLLIKLAEHGLIHGDFNEFNLIIMNDTLEVKMIDFPQCISVDHPNASEFFSRDVRNLNNFFIRRYKMDNLSEPQLKKDVNIAPAVLLASDAAAEVGSEEGTVLVNRKRLDLLAFASGCFSVSQQKELEKAAIRGDVIRGDKRFGNGKQADENDYERESNNDSDNSSEKVFEEPSEDEKIIDDDKNIKNQDEESVTSTAASSAKKATKINLVQRNKYGEIILLQRKMKESAESSGGGIRTVLPTATTAPNEEYINKKVKRMGEKDDNMEFMRRLNRNVQKGKRGKKKSNGKKSKFVQIE